MCRLISIVLCFLVVSDLRADDWPQFLGPTRNLRYTGKGIADKWPVSGPTVVWKKRVGKGLAGAAVSGDKLIFFHRVGDEETVECLDPETGVQNWSQSYATTYRDNYGMDEGPRGTPAIAGGFVYTHGAQGVLQCLDLKTGKVVWRVDTKKLHGSRKGFFGRACSPLVEGNLVLLNVGGPKAGIAGFDAKTGRTVWTATKDEAGYASPVAATIDGKRLAFFYTREQLMVVEPKTGKMVLSRRWRSRNELSVNAATPIVSGSRIFLSTSYGVGATVIEFKGQKVKTLWSADGVMSSHYSTAVESDGFVYGFDGRQETGQRLRCIEMLTGKVRWTVDDMAAGTVMIADGKLIVLTQDGELIMAPATPNGFTQSGRSQILGFHTRAYPALAGGLFFARDGRQLVCIDLRSR